MLPSVEQLTVHLPGEQAVVYNPTEEEANEALEKNYTTKLTAYFAANAMPGVNLLIGDVKYEDMPYYCTWDQSNRCWKIRERGGSIGRMVGIHPSQKEAFYLRLLLKVVTGPTSYEDV